MSGLSIILPVRFKTGGVSGVLWVSFVGQPWRPLDRGMYSLVTARAIDLVFNAALHTVCSERITRLFVPLRYHRAFLVQVPYV